MMLVKLDEDTWVNPDDVVVISRKNSYHSSVELRTGTRVLVSTSPKETAEKLMAASS